MKLLHALSCGLLLLAFSGLSLGHINPKFVPRPPKQMGTLTVLSCRNIDERTARILAIGPNGKEFSAKVSNYQCKMIRGWDEWSERLDEARKRNPFKVRLQ